MQASCELLHVLLIPFAVLLSTAVGQGGVRPVTGDDEGDCEPIDSEVCANVGYNIVFVPNARGHQMQSAAEAEIRDFVQLIQTGCSDALNVFLCSYYFPLCFIDPSTNTATKVKTCRSLCVFVRSACEPTLNSLGNLNLSWPVFLNCSLDDFSDDASCFGPAVLTNLSIPSSESPPVSATPVQVLSDPTPTATPTVVSVAPTPPPQSPPVTGEDHTTTNSARVLNAKALINKVLFVTITLVVLICNHLI